jgi:hypothetical protein
MFFVITSRSVRVLTHAPVVSLGAEEAMDEDDRAAFHALLRIGLVEIVCDLDSIAEVCGGERASRLSLEGLPDRRS